MALEGFEATLSYYSGGWVDLAGVVSVNGPEMTVDKIERSSSDSRWKGKVPGQIDAGPVEVELQYDSSQTATLYSLLGVKDQSYKVEYSDGSGWTFSGYLSKLGAEAPHDGDIKQSAAFEVNGEPTAVA